MFYKLYKNSKFKKICLISLLIGFLFLSFSGFSFAQEPDEKPKKLEVAYPEVAYPLVAGAETPTDIKTPLPEYIRYLFSFVIMLAALIAFGALVYGGARYVSSAGSPAAMKDAWEQIFAGILGFIIILSSYMILTTINPQLVLLRADLKPIGAPVGDMPGVYLCKSHDQYVEDGRIFTSKNCALYDDTSDTLSPKIDQQVGFIAFKNVVDKDNKIITRFGAVLHKERHRKGECRVFHSNATIDKGSRYVNFSSITVFRIDNHGDGKGVSFYRDSNYEYLIGGPYKKIYEDAHNKYIPKNHKDVELKYAEGKSIKIEGKYMAVLFQHKDGRGNCEVFTRSDSSLAANHIGVCGTWNNWGCFESIIVLPIK